MKEPKVFLVGQSAAVPEGIQAYLAHLGVTKWPNSDASDPELLIELMGRLCYRSFEVGLNKNITKIRESNEEYLANIIKVKHGSVMEHASFNFIFADVSRVFTHELVRHRVGTAMSQESLRFVRLEEIDGWIPSVIREDSYAMELFRSTFEGLGDLQKSLAEMLHLDSVPFSEKKKITSAMRRLAPLGLPTSIGWTANVRTLRWLLEMRTHPSAEEEIRLVFGHVGRIVRKKCPHLFADYEVEEVDGLDWWHTESGKV